MHKRLKFIIIFILGISICTFVKTSFAESTETVRPKNDSLKSGLYLDVDDLIEYRAEAGLRNLEPHAIVLTNTGLKAYDEKREKEAIVFFEKANELSPDMPGPYLYLAKANFSFSLKGIYVASGYLSDAWRAFGNNFWLLFQTTGVLFLSLFFALYVSSIVFLIALVHSKFGIYIHEIIEDKRKIFLLLPAIVLVFFGPIFGILGLMLPFLMYMRGKEKIILYGIFLILALVILMNPLLSSFPGAYQDKTLRDIIKINAGMYTGETPEIFSNERSYETSFVYAMDLKRKGYYNQANYVEAIKIYKGLLNQKEDAKVYNNLANCYIALGNSDNYNIAVTYYKKALRLKRMASTYYNLSQIYREVFNFADAEKYYEEAIKIDPRKVVFYNSIKGTSVNRFVIDEPLGNKELWSLAFKRFPHYKSSMLGRMFSFANKGFSIVLLVLLIIAFYIYRKYVSYGAYRCRRCGEVYCSRCERRISHEDVCIMCFKTLVKISELGPKERIERILEIQHHRNKRNRHLKILTFIFPGSGHVYYGWPVLGFTIILSFAFFLFSTLLWFYIPPPVSMTQITLFFRWVSVLGFILIYVAAVINVYRRIPRKWL